MWLLFAVTLSPSVSFLCPRSPTVKDWKRPRLNCISRRTSTCPHIHSLLPSFRPSTLHSLPLLVFPSFTSPFLSSSHHAILSSGPHVVFLKWLSDPSPAWTLATTFCFSSPRSDGVPAQVLLQRVPCGGLGRAGAHDRRLGHRHGHALWIKVRRGWHDLLYTWCFEVAVPLSWLSFSSHLVW